MSLPRFVLLDNSLIEVGGHFLEHAVSLLKAATLADLQPVLATNRAFEQREAVPSGWLVLLTRRCATHSSLNAPLGTLIHIIASLSVRHGGQG